jgi:hypothetical protein
MDAFTLRAIDVSGDTVGLNVWHRYDVVDICSGARTLGEFVRDDLAKWLNNPSGQLSDRDIRWKGVAGAIVLDVRVLFVSHVVAERDLDPLKAYVSSANAVSALASADASVVQAARTESELRRSGWKS